ncbi:hypothetical protein SVAN01_05672 [Stagonosporopsis vannaccii]|nr:hypothetical protein SVAN01_05672 [Stagonosporopsis vannaccii]
MPLPTLTVDPATPLPPLKSMKSSSSAGIVGGLAAIVRVAWIMLRLRRQRRVGILSNTTIMYREDVAEYMHGSHQFGEPLTKLGDQSNVTTPHVDNKAPAAVVNYAATWARTN